jgi:hypothetical protein
MHTLNPYSGTFPLPGEGKENQERKRNKKYLELLTVAGGLPFNEDRLRLRIPVRFWFSGCVFR